MLSNRAGRTLRKDVLILLVASAALDPFGNIIGVIHNPYFSLPDAE